MRLKMSLKVLKSIEFSALFDDKNPPEEGTFWFELLQEDLEHFRKNSLNKTLPKAMNRNGAYYCTKRKVAWIEYMNETFEICPKHFKFKLKLHEASELKPEEIKALKAMKGTKFFQKNHAELLNALDTIKKQKDIKNFTTKFIKQTQLTKN